MIGTYQFRLNNAPWSGSTQLLDSQVCVKQNPDSDLDSQLVSLIEFNLKIQINSYRSDIPWLISSAVSILFLRRIGYHWTINGTLETMVIGNFVQ